MTIRQSTESDRAAIGDVHLSAFGQEQGPEIVELVHGLLDDATAKPLLSLVAEKEGRLVGHILFTQVRLLPVEREVSGQILAPLGVSRDFQGQGIGGALINAGLQQLTQAGVDFVFVLGHPSYYPKYGFQPAGKLGLEAPYPIPPEHADAWMVQELRAGVLGRVTGTVQCAKVLSDPKHWSE